MSWCDSRHFQNEETNEGGEAYLGKKTRPGDFKLGVKEPQAEQVDSDQEGDPNPMRPGIGERSGSSAELKRQHGQDEIRDQR